MNQKVLWSSLLVSGLMLSASAASADGLPRFAASTCPLAAAAKPGAACGDVEASALFGGVTLVSTEDDGQVLVDSRRVVAVLGLRGPDVIRLDQAADIPTGSIEPTR